MIEIDRTIDWDCAQFKKRFSSKGTKTSNVGHPFRTTFNTGLRAAIVKKITEPNLPAI